MPNFQKGMFYGIHDDDDNNEFSYDFCQNHKSKLKGYKSKFQNSYCFNKITLCVNACARN